MVELALYFMGWRLDPGLILDILLAGQETVRKKLRSRRICVRLHVNGTCYVDDMEMMRDVFLFVDAGEV